MRTLYLFSVLAAVLIFTACGHDTTNDVQAPLADIVQTLPANNTLSGIQSKIETASNESFFGVDEAPLEELRKEIIQVQGKEYERLVAYWTAYTDFQTSIFKLKINDLDGSEATARRGIAALEAIEGKNAEELALQAFMEGFVIQFTEGVESAKAAQSASKNLEKALALNPDNMRVQYVAGSMDYYTPAEYGGGQNTEAYLTQAISLPEQEEDNAFLPTWGKAGAYEVLVRYYSDAANEATAQRYLQEGLQQFPDDYQLTAMARQN